MIEPQIAQERVNDDSRPALYTSFSALLINAKTRWIYTVWKSVWAAVNLHISAEFAAEHRKDELNMASP